MYLKVKLLKKVLESYDDETFVFLSVDEEGNEIKPMPDKYFFSDENPNENCMQPNVEEDFEDIEKVLVLWPIG